MDARVVVERLLAALGARRWSPPVSVSRPAVSRRLCIASAVTVRPRSSSSPVTAVIPFDLPSTLTWPGSSPLSAAKACTGWSGERSGASPKDRRSALPSMAVTSPGRAPGRTASG